MKKQIKDNQPRHQHEWETVYRGKTVYQKNANTTPVIGLVDYAYLVCQCTKVKKVRVE